VLIAWRPGSTKVTIGGKPAFDESSVHVRLGGVVTVSSPGQGSVSLG
jgi:hypothetical protein